MKSEKIRSNRISESGNIESGTRRNFENKFSYKPIFNGENVRINTTNQIKKQTYLIFLSLVESPNLGVVRWVLGNKAEDGGWVLLLVESSDLVFPDGFWVTKGRMGLGGTKPRMEAGFLYGV